MLVYWLMYLIPAAMTIFVSRHMSQQYWTPWILIGLLFIVLIGFRHEVGGDWGSYLYHYHRVVGVTLEKALTRGDPGYVFLNWLMASWGWGIYGVNLIAAVFFVAGLTVFCRQQTIPWLAFSVAVPYLVVVVAMGYTRQGIALGLLFWAISYLEQGRFKHYLLVMAVAALFHKSAILMIPLGLFLYGKGWTLRVVAILLASYGLWDVLLADEQERLWELYVDAAYQSQGARIRVFMNLVPSLLLIFYWKRWKQSYPNPWFWYWLALASVVSVGLVDIASTAVDRVALYFTPIQVAVFSRLPYLAREQVPPQIMVIGILFGYAVVLFVWLNYASHAQYWLPYQNVMF